MKPFHFLNCILSFIKKKTTWKGKYQSTENPTIGKERETLTGKMKNVERHTQIQGSLTEMFWWSQMSFIRRSLNFFGKFPLSFPIVVFIKKKFVYAILHNPKFKDLWQKHHGLRGGPYPLEDLQTCHIYSFLCRN